MKLDHHARRELVKEVWRMFVMYASSIHIRFHDQTVVITINTKEPVEVDGVKYINILDWNRYDEVPLPDRQP